MKQRIKAIIGSLISAIVAMLGFSGCNGGEAPDEPGALMYGSPYGEFQFNGLVTDGSGSPIEKARVIVRTVVDEHGNYIHRPVICDTVFTDKSGMYKGAMRTNTDTAMILCEDPAGKYLSDSTEVALKYISSKQPEYKEFQGGDWFVGTATAKTNFTLRKVPEKE